MSDFDNLFNSTSSEMQWEAFGDMPLPISSPIPNSRQLRSAEASLTPYHPIEPPLSSANWALRTNELDKGFSSNPIPTYSLPDLQLPIGVDRTSECVE